MFRLFVGLRPPAAIRARLLDLMGGVPGARWQDDEQLHCTVRFIGEVDRRVAEDVVAALGSAVTPLPLLHLASVGRFARQGRTHTLWAGVAPAEPLLRLHAKVDRALVRVGLAPDQRSYQPHITLARLTPSQTNEAWIDRFLADHAALGSPPFSIGHLALFESSLGHGGASYTCVERWPLP